MLFLAFIIIMRKPHGVATEYHEQRRWTENARHALASPMSLEYILGQHALAHIDGRSAERFNAEWADAIVASVGPGPGGGNLRFLRTVRAMVEMFNINLDDAEMTRRVAMFYSILSCRDRHTLADAYRHLEAYRHQSTYWRRRPPLERPLSDEFYEHAIATMLTATALGLWMHAVL